MQINSPCGLTEWLCCWQDTKAAPAPAAKAKEAPTEAGGSTKKVKFQGKEVNARVVGGGNDPIYIGFDKTCAASNQNFLQGLQGLTEREGCHRDWTYSAA